MARFLVPGDTGAESACSAAGWGEAFGTVLSEAGSLDCAPDAQPRASGGPGWRTRMKAAHRRYRMPRQDGSSMLRRATASRRVATGPSLAVLLYHGLRRDEVARLTVGSLHEHRGVPHFRVTGKGAKTRPVPVHPAALSALGDYLELAEHRHDRNAPLFQPTQARWAGRPLTGDGIYKLVRKYASAAAIPMERIVHALRATAATNALEHEADIARVQDWLGHANVSTTRLYDRRDRRPEDSPRSASATDELPAGFSGRDKAWKLLLLTIGVSGAGVRRKRGL